MKELPDLSKSKQGLKFESLLNLLIRKKNENTKNSSDEIKEEISRETCTIYLFMEAKVDIYLNQRTPK